ncbi:RagB/SusD family nutrient uptake outer membrane protein [Mangrovibacterium diazotrophicum]|uniref:Putative outer membrane starch-binding protein n=1 Tax=Mangrovibacterium diazotrophicum TaxID=1261403 RepID=A0A419W4H3_9BACT|nr:RagB/SusD family nutrient uptake outer membrane protein [Mangrovibacterium diazotrophicum]RKD90345.1 putative outer membrane starch-binding protein [Mangrovibacterium diazotrophicum]
MKHKLNITRGYFVKHFTSILLLLFLIVGCSEDFLVQKNTTSINEETLFTEPDDGYSLVTSVYAAFYYNVDYTLKGIWFTANFLTQDFHNEGSDTFWNTYEVPTDFSALNTFWIASYIGVSRANAAIPILEKMKANGVFDTDAEVDQLISECYFLRGFFYYYLASDFGGVPLELETVTDEGLHPRATQDEVFASVASDMELAFENLPWAADLDAEDAGRATKEAALAYWGEALMWQKDYSGAISKFDQLASKCELEEDFMEIHNIDNWHGKESIFEIQFLDYGKMNWGAYGVHNQWISSFGMPVAVSGFGYAYADKALYDSFETGDTRKAATVVGPGDEHPSDLINFEDYPKVISFATNGNGSIPATYYQDEDGNPLNTCGTADNPWNEGTRSGYYGTKFWRNPETCGTKGASWFMSSDNIMMMRYAQVLLSKAECEYHLSNETEAWALVDEVRDRAFGKLADASVVVPEPVESDLMKVILDEYRHEFAGEMSAWFLLRRSGEHIDYIKEKFGIDIPTGKDLMPIPQTQIGLNPNLEQNPGY